jgi:crotonobetainyl-CoA:carnitine CoA-transferase CaiB-like acyl-CoA transferase
MTAKSRQVAPLTGIRVLDLTSFLGGPYASMLLADLGADVIKVESPPRGDPSRDRQDVAGYSSAYAGVNRNKRSLVLDFKNASTRPLFHRLVKSSDVLLVSIRPRSRAPLGLDYKTLREVNSRLIYCSVTGYGESGAALDVPAMDTTAQAMSGLLSLVAGKIEGEVSIGAYLSDVLVGLFACNGVLAAITARSLNGEGQEVRTSLLQASLAFELFNFFILFAAEDAGRNTTNRPAHYLLRGSDNLPFAAHIPPSPDRVWHNFAAALGLDSLTSDPRFSTKALRAENYSALHGVISEHTRKTKSRAEWIELLRVRELPCAPVYELSEVFGDPIVKSLEMLKMFADPWGKSCRTIGSGVDFSATPTVAPVRAPLLGEHNREILTDLGLGVAEIEELERAGVICSANQEKPA